MLPLVNITLAPFAPRCHYPTGRYLFVNSLKNNIPPHRNEIIYFNFNFFFIIYLYIYTNSDRILLCNSLFLFSISPSPSLINVLFRLRLQIDFLANLYTNMYIILLYYYTTSIIYTIIYIYICVYTYPQPRVIALYDIRTLEATKLYDGGQ